MTALSNTHAAIPGPIRWVLFLIGLTVGLSALAGAVLSAVPPLLGLEHPEWVLTLYELVVLGSCAALILLGLGRFAQAPGLVLGTVAFCMAASAVLAAIGTNSRIGDYNFRPIAFARIGAGAAVGLCAVVVRITSKAAAVRLLIGSALLAPLAVLAVVFATRSTDVLTTQVERLGPFFSIVAWLVLGMLFLIVLPAGGHLIITAFERHRDHPDQNPAGHSPKDPA